MTLAEELAWRGFVNQMTFADIGMVNEPRTFYWGVDPSADSMTIGNLAAAMMVRHFIDHGHKAILLVGGATGMVGDPDGKKQERELLTVEDIARNKASIAAQYKTIFNGQDFEIVDNYDWFKNMNYLTFLRDVGKHASVTQLLDRDFVQRRIGEGGSGLSYAEFSYSLIQGYDFLHLFREKKVTLQLAGADQWGNSIAGVQLIRRLEAGQAHVFTAPLVVNKQTGVKFGKSEGGAIWLDAKKTSAFQFYQFWLNLDDEGVEDYLKIYTFLTRKSIEAIMEQHHESPGARTAQRNLAKLVTSLVHGGEKGQQMEDVSRMLFGDLTFSQLLDEDVEVLAGEFPVVSSEKLIEALVEGGLATSNGEARRLISSGAVTVNDEKASDDMQLNKPSFIKKGKNSFTLVR